MRWHKVSELNWTYMPFMKACASGFCTPIILHSSRQLDVAVGGTFVTSAASFTDRMLSGKREAIRLELLYSYHSIAPSRSEPEIKIPVSHRAHKPKTKWAVAARVQQMSAQVNSVLISSCKYLATKIPSTNPRQTRKAG